MSLGIFESLAIDEDAQRRAARSAQLLADARVNRRLGPMLAMASGPAEFDARLSLVDDDLRGIVAEACAEAGYERPEATYRALVDHYRPQDVARDVRTASTKVSRDRVKMCPYHREVTDISLAAGDPTAGFNAMSPHAWSAQHCKGEGFEGSCNFKREMVTQSFWDDRAERARERREAPEVSDAPSLSEPVGDDLAPLDDASLDSPSLDLGEAPEVAEAPQEAFEPALTSTHARIKAGGHFLAGAEPVAVEAPASQGPAAPFVNPGEVQEAMQVLQRAAMVGGPQQQQRAMTLLGQLSGVIFGGVTAAVRPSSPPLPPPAQRSFVPGVGMEPPASPGLGAPQAPTPQGPMLSPTQLQLQQALLAQQQAQQQEVQPGSMAPTRVPPSTPQPPMPMVAAWTPRIGEATLSKKVACPSCGGDGKGAGGKQCSKCMGMGKVEDWGNSVLDELDGSPKTSADGNTGLGGPEPKIDERKWTPKTVKKPQDDSRQNPTKTKDILDPIPYLNDAPLEEIGERTTERVSLPTATGPDGAGFEPGGQVAPHTDTWHGRGGQVDPVTSSSNPVRDLVERDFDGFAPQAVVDRAFARLR